MRVLATSRSCARSPAITPHAASVQATTSTAARRDAQDNTSDRHRVDFTRTPVRIERLRGPSELAPTTVRADRSGVAVPAPLALALPGVIQAKLSVGAVNDPLEAEADRVAAHVLRTPDPAPAIGSTSTRVSRACAACEEDEKTHAGHVQRTAAPSASTEVAAPAIVHDVLRSPGQPLDAPTRAFFEPRFGHDFSSVRVHANERATQSAAAIDALAYTVGPNIVFGAGQYAPHEAVRSHLLAHELTHVVQQANAGHTAIRRQEDGAAEQAEPLAGPSAMPKPRPAPSCADICGDKEHCIQERGETCDTKMTNAAMAAWQTVAANVTTAIDHMTNTPQSPTLVQSLTDNFSWKGTPADLPPTVKSQLAKAQGHMSDNLCIKCPTQCPPNAVAMIDRARGQNCLDFNCFRICPSFKSPPKQTEVHALTHELMHRVARNQTRDLYRGDPSYPGPPSMALKLPDAYASLVDDLVSAPVAAPSPPVSAPGPP
jgi:hypothetical protein